MYIANSIHILTVSITNKAWTKLSKYQHIVETLQLLNIDIKLDIENGMRI